jgi:hypothetical protein
MRVAGSDSAATAARATGGEAGAHAAQASAADATRAVLREADLGREENRSRKAAGAAFGGERSERGAKPQRTNRALAPEGRPAVGGFHGLLKAIEKRTKSGIRWRM